MEEYPIEILPEPNKKCIDRSLDDYYIIRYTKETTKAEIVGTDGLVKNQYFQSTELPDCSFTLPGIFKREYIYIKLTKNGNLHYGHYCDPNAKVDIPKYDIDYEILGNRHYIQLRIGDINNKVINCVTENITASAKVCHTPMKWNFWHFSVRWYINNYECFWNYLEDVDKKRLEKLMKHETRTALKLYTEFGTDDIFNKSLDESDYLVNPS